jgi:hypothetical protein
MGNILENVEKVPQVPVSSDDMVYVTIPSEDLYDYTHPGVQLNAVKFEPGNTYKVPAAVGAEVEQRLAMFNKEQIRLLRPKVDGKSINQVNSGSNWSRGGGGSIGSHEGIANSFAANEKVIEVKW